MACLIKRSSCYQVKITKVEKFSQFVKITAQNINDADYVQLTNGLENVYKSSKELRDEELELGELFVAKVNNSYSRCRILDSDDFSSIALVDFIDLGHHGRVKYSDLRAFSEKSSDIKILPSISKEFILAELIIIEHDACKFKRLQDLITYKFASMVIMGQNDLGKFVDLRFAQSSLVQHIILKHPILNTVFKHISLENQLKLVDKQSSPVAKKANQSTQKSPKISEYTLPTQFHFPNNCYVKISSYEKGPKEFYIQLIESLQKYQNLNIKLRSRKNTFKHIANPQFDEMYVAVYEQDSVERVAILEKINESLYVVRFLDDGAKRVINSSQICELPEELKKEPFAWKFALNGIDFEMLHLRPNELNFYFLYLTHEKKLRLQLDKKAQKKDEINLCSLYDGNLNILNLIKSFNPRALKYPAQMQLSININLEAKISSFESPNLFYINVCNNDCEASKFFTDFETFNPCIFEKPEKDNLCCVNVKGKNYRGKVLKPLSAFTVTCQLVDLGQIDDFSSNEIKLMVEEFTTLPPIAYKCSLFGLDRSKLNLDDSKIFRDICTRNQVFSVTVKEHKENIYYVELETADKKNVLDEIMKSSFLNHLNVPPVRRFAVRRQRSNSFRISPQNKMTEPLKLSNMDWNDDEWSSSEELWTTLGSPRDKFENDIAMIASVESPNDFIIHLKNSIPELNNFLNKLQKLGENGDPLVAFEKSEMCLVKNPLSNEWFRAMILDSSFEENNIMIKLKNVDDGRSYTLDNPKELKKYPFSCLTVPYFGIRCSLPVKISKKNLFEATEMLIHLIGKEIKYTIICANEFVNVIDIKPIKGKNVIQELLKANLATRLEYIISGTGNITHVENLSEFYVTLDGEKGMLDTLFLSGQKYQRKPIENQMKINDLIMAKSRLNDHWARAKVIAIDSDVIEVKFIDQGYCEKVDMNDIGEVPTEFEYLRPLTHCCSLYVPKNINLESDAAVKRFKEIAAQDSFFFKMMVPTSRRSVVQILKYPADGQPPINIGNEIVALCDIFEEQNKSQDISSILEDD